MKGGRGFGRILRPLGALAGLAGAAALLNSRLRATSAIPYDHIGGKRRRWSWRGHGIFVAELGEGSPILLVHGIYVGASSYEFRRLAPLLARSHRVIYFDLLGCGLSEMPKLDYTADLFVEQIVDAIAEFCDDPVTLVGSSLGGALTIRAAARAPERVKGLIAICPTGLGGVLDEGPAPARRALRSSLRWPVLGEAAFNALASRISIARFLRTEAYADAAAITSETIEQYYAVAHQPGARFVPAAFIGGGLNCNVARDLPFVPAPTLIIWGARASPTNPLGNAPEFVRLARDARLETLANSALLPHEEQPEATADSIASFLGDAPQRSEAARAMSTPPANDSTTLDRIFKSYDVRGIYPAELSNEIAYEIGRLFPGAIEGTNIAIGRDMRPSGEQLFESLARGITEAGGDVTDIGMVSTDALYFAVGKYGFDGGIMITASHNPANYNGLKFTRARAEALSLSDGLAVIRDKLSSASLPQPAAKKGSIARKEILAAFAAHCLSFIDPRTIKPFRIAIDAGNGMAGKTVPEVFKHLPAIEVIPLFFELDGEFPNHPASPIEPANMVDVQRAVVENGCDLGVAFDGDADRMFIVDERGGLVGGDMVTALVGLNTLKRYPGAKILYNLICSRSVPEAIERAGGQPIRSPVGHSLIKKIMRDEDVVFGGEHSGHFYFRDNWYADSGMIALLQCLEVFSDAGKPVSKVIAPINTRFRSGEINSRVHDIPTKLSEIERHYSDGEIDHLDGITVEYPDWWLNVRASNTEPLLRLNVEGDTKELMEQHRDEVLALIRS